MKTYFDTGVLVKIYVQEPNSEEAIALVAAVGRPVPFSPFHAVELPTAIRLKRFRQEITAAEEAAALSLVQADVDTGRLQRTHHDLPRLIHRAESLSAQYAAVLGTRSMDILHVSAALEEGCAEFVSFDRRQRKMAGKEGLKVTPRRTVSDRE